MTYPQRRAALRRAWAILRGFKKGELALLEALSLTHQLSPPQWVNEGYDSLRTNKVVLFPCREQR